MFGNMGSGVPLLNEYKQDFFWKRFPQTILGGPKFRLGYDAPCYVYTGQLMVFIIPWFIGGLLTLLVQYRVLTYDMSVYVYGSTMCLFVLSCQITASVIQRHQANSGKLGHKSNLLAEEDEVDFLSCCGTETLSFIIPPKKYKVNIVLHGITSGVMCGLGLWYLLPDTLNVLYNNNVGATVVLFVFGWLTLCIAQYPLTTCAPPEPASFRTLDTFELSTLIRPFYVLIFQTFFLMGRYLPDFVLADQILHAVFVCLPVLWVLGILPPLDAAFLWSLEQFLVIFLGGSPTASDCWTIIMVILSAGVFLAVYFIPVCVGSLGVAASLGYILSTDIGGLVREILKYYGTRNKVSSSQTYSEPEHMYRGLPFKKMFVKFLFHSLMTGAVMSFSVCLVHFKSRLYTNSWYVLGYVIIGLLFLEKVLRDAQGIYLCFGLWRNKLFPESIHRHRDFMNRKKYLRVLGFIRICLINIVAPFVMLSYLCLLLDVADASSLPCGSGLSTAMNVWFSFAITRSFRWIWQGTVHSLLEISVVHIVLITLSTDPTVLSLGVFKLLLLISLTRDRFYQASNKLYFCVTLLITSWTDKKQRRKSSLGLVLVNVLLFPVVLAVVVAASALSAPLLPLFTLPIFLIGFPRPLRSWPSAVGASANTCADTVFYKQLSYNLAAAMRTSFANGSLGEPHPGNHYLVRFQDRMVWVMILERGASFCTMSIKGLELQETSCHSVEATRVDDIFDSALDRENGFSLCSLNNYPLHTLTPCDAALIKTYSDARNILTGIIDSPDNFKFVFSCFPKALIWVLMKEVLKINSKKKQQKEESALKKLDSADSLSNNNNKKEVHVPQKDTVVRIGATNAAQSEQTHATMVQELDDLWSESRPTSALSVTGKRKSSWGSFSSILSIDNDHIEMDDVKTAKTKTLRGNLRKSSDSIEDLGFGLPVVDPSVKPKNYPHKQAFQVSGKSGNSIYRPVTNLAGSAEFTCSHSSRLSLPVKWRELPIEESRVKKLKQDFPTDWYRYVIEGLKLETQEQSVDEVTAELVKDDVLHDIYAQLTMACCAVFDANGMTSHGGGTSHLYKCYRGDVPWNAMLDWLTEDKLLFGLVLQAYRYAFKLMLDQCVLGEITDHSEMSEYLEEYDRDWYIGLDSDPEWNSAVLNNKPSLFSVGHSTNQGTYSSRVVTLQDTLVQIGRLNSEAVKGQWANLSMELLYFTNDDEERYSIQAHPTLLRNLTVQSADPPLGYPIFSSEPISVSLFFH